LITNHNNLGKGYEATDTVASEPIDVVQKFGTVLALQGRQFRYGWIHCGLMYQYGSKIWLWMLVELYLRGTNETGPEE
jgi:hypothetical protein